mmetsp:Transcript_2581/g.7940  ORF Transcript_2581/g.7940 Transcript_2581/m.7940 type:complete len:229 (-) Transcript_2581:573-1259(-)
MLRITSLSALVVSGKQALRQLEGLLHKLDTQDAAEWEERVGRKDGEPGPCAQVDELAEDVCRRRRASADAPQHRREALDAHVARGELLAEGLHLCVLAHLEGLLREQSVKQLRVVAVEVAGAVRVRRRRPRVAGRKVVGLDYEQPHAGGPRVGNPRAAPDLHDRETAASQPTARLHLQRVGNALHVDDVQALVYLLPAGGILHRAAPEHPADQLRATRRDGSSVAGAV